MVTVVPPAVICMPQLKYSEEFHEYHRVLWDEESDKSNITIYRPMLLYGAKVGVGVRALVGNVLPTSSCDQLQAKSEEVKSQTREPNLHKKETTKIINCIL